MNTDTLAIVIGSIYLLLAATFIILNYYYTKKDIFNRFVEYWNRQLEIYNNNKTKKHGS